MTQLRPRWLVKQVTTNECIEIPNSGTYSIGRHAQAKICLLSSKVSRFHANIMVDEEGKLLLQDIKSSNGTYVNGKLLANYKPQVVNNGDNLSFGLLHIALCTDDRDEKCFFQVMKVNQSSNSALEAADSTTEAIDVIQSSCDSHFSEQNPVIIDLCSQSDDVILPQPPFKEASNTLQKPVVCNGAGPSVTLEHQLLNSPPSRASNRISARRETLRVDRGVDSPENQEEKSKTPPHEQQELNTIFLEQENDSFNELLHNLDMELEDVQMPETTTTSAKEKSEKNKSNKNDNVKDCCEPKEKAPMKNKALKRKSTSKSEKQSFESKKHNLGQFSENVTKKKRKTTSDESKKDIADENEKTTPIIENTTNEIVKISLDQSKKNIADENKTAPIIENTTNKIVKISLDQSKKNIADENKKTTPIIENTTNKIVKISLDQSKKNIADENKKTIPIIENTVKDNLILDSSENKKSEPNLAVFDLTNDSDDDVDFSCSQIFQMSQKVKTEIKDDQYQKIKSELAEMDFYNDLVINPTIIDIADEDKLRFENTQDIQACLEEEIVDKPKENNVLSDLSLFEQNGCMESPVFDLENEAVEEDNKKNENSSDKGNGKRKTSTDSRQGKKKLKTSLDPKKFSCKDITAELKRRNSSHEISFDKQERRKIREERKKKLKELTSSATSTNNDKNASMVSRESSFENSPSRSKPRVAHDREEKNPNLKKPKSSKEDVVIKPNKRRTVDYRPSEIDSNSLPSSSYNLRRTNSCELIKPSSERNTSNKKRIELIPPPVANKKKVKVVVDVQPKEKPGNNVAEKPSNSHFQRDASTRLMWTNGGPIKKIQHSRQLPKVEDIIRIMLKDWDPTWFLSHIDNAANPPLSDSTAPKIPLSFQHFNHYYETFSQLVLMENWQYLFKGFREVDENPVGVKIEHSRVDGDLLTLDCSRCITLSELKKGQIYRPDDFVLLEYLVSEVNRNYTSLNFGLITHCRKVTMSVEETKTVKRKKNNELPHTKLLFTVITYYRPNRKINASKMPIIKQLNNIRAHLMLIRAIKTLKSSPICRMILKPHVNDYQYLVTHTYVKFHNLELNERQRTTVVEAASLCTGTKPGVYCVKGPPGTGKSTVIINLIFKIILSSNLERGSGQTPLILLAAPSNAAVDNLVSKMMVLKQSLASEGMRHHIKCVRIGPEASIDKDVKGYSLHSLAEKHMPLKTYGYPEIQAARERYEKLTPDVIRSALGEERYQQEMKMCENLIIEKSNIICTTLNSCINGRLIDAVDRNIIKFTCCIIDESTQCHEVESLLPLILGIDKFVLVGDPQQLNATVMHRDAQRRGFQQSLFTRIANCFGNDSRSPVRMLINQYRMHPEICHFPNKQFYNGALRTMANPHNKLAINIQPYLVFNCEKSNVSADYTNRNEVSLIKKLLATIFSLLSKHFRYTVGIITPYNAQKELICNSILQLIAENDNCKISVNTVDSFQGSENDIIIISCVRDSSNSFLQNENRLNVALTRAKQALYIIGNYSLFKECRPLYDLREDAKKRKVLLDIRQNVTIKDLRMCLIEKRHKS